MDNSVVHRFLKQHFLHWLEALALLGLISISLEFIATLQRLVRSFSV